MRKNQLYFPAICTWLLLIFQNLNAQKADYVQSRDHQFMINHKPLYYIGTNYWYGGLLGLKKNNKQGVDRLRAELDFLKQKGVNNLRVLAGPEGEGLISGVDRIKPPLQIRRGIFDKDFLTGLDLLLSEMAKRDMKAIVFLSNNWEWSGGFLQYLRWNDEISDSVFRGKMNWDETRDYVSKFYSCEECKKDYLKQVEYIINHVNVVNHKKYTEDPAIMTWELANEPRPMRPGAVENYKKWIRAASSFIKSIDTNHLVTIGTEGYIGTENIRIYEEIHADKNIDYLTIHIWPKNWEWFKGRNIAAGMDSILEKTMNYIAAHLAVANKLNKPLVIEEFGLPRDEHSFDAGSATSNRDRYFQNIFTVWYQSKKNNSAIAGVNFWSYGGAIKPAHEHWQDGDDYIGDPPMEEQGLNAVFNTDKTTWNVIESFSKK